MAANDDIRKSRSTEDQETVEFRVAPELPAGTPLKDRYLLIRQLGRGGFGSVYLAHDRQMHDRPVVVKIQVDQSIDDPWFERKFSEEVRALSMIDHPGVVVAIDSGRTPDGKPFLVMQYVDGVTLRSAMTAEGIPLDRAANILKQVGHALGAAHGKGILHRDLKPENLMLQTSADAGERVRLIDFGIASVADFENKYQTSTRLSGTILYMAPEQLLGQPSKLTDIYAMGLIAYEMVTGRRPFIADNAVQLAAMQKSGVRIRPSDLRPALPAIAERLILKSLEYEPSKRPADAHAFGDELHDALLASGAPATQRKAAAGRGSRALTVVIALVAAGLALAGAAYYAFRPHPKAEAVAQNSPTDAAIELAFWNSVKDSSEPQLYREYLNKYPNGRFETLAKLKLQVLDRKASPQSSTGQTKPQDPEGAFWKGIEQASDPQLYQEYLDQYPHGRFAASAQTKLKQAPGFTGLENIPVPGLPNLGSSPAVDPKVFSELSAWKSLKGTRDAQPYRDFLAKYPHGMFAPLARIQIATFDKAAGK